MITKNQEKQLESNVLICGRKYIFLLMSVKGGNSKYISSLIPDTAEGSLGNLREQNGFLYFIHLMYSSI